MHPHLAARSWQGNRRAFLTVTGASLAAGVWNLEAAEGEKLPRARMKKVAAIVTVYTHNSHADVIVGRLLESHTLDGKGTWPAQPWSRLQLVSLYIDQPATPKDKGAALAKTHSFRLSQTIADALTCGGSKLAVDGVLLIGEHGDYPLSETGQIMYPRRRFFEETINVFREQRRVVPVFLDKHLAWNWADAKWIYDTARQMKVPLMAGSSVPGTWRHPPLEMKRRARVQEAIALSYGPLEAYGFHALEALQSLVERRRGGETGVRAVQFVSGPDVWRQQGRFSADLLAAALERRENKARFKGSFEAVVKRPVAFFIEYRDGLHATVIHDAYDASNEWIVAWREKGHVEIPATVFWTQEARPLGHFAFLVQGIERLIWTRHSPWPVERTLLTTGVLAALFRSKNQNGERIETPHLAIAYQPASDWSDPPPPPPGRPFSEQ